MSRIILVRVLSNTVYAAFMTGRMQLWDPKEVPKPLANPRSFMGGDFFHVEASRDCGIAAETE